MSPNVGNFVHDLVEMAKAHDRLPGLEAELERAKELIDQQAENVQRLELRLIDKANEIAALHSTNRDLEVARDAAELRFLEANDRTERALEFVKAQFGAAGGLIQSLEPPKPEPEPVKEEPKAEDPATSVTGTTSSFEGQSDSPPTQTVHTPDVATGDATETSSAEVAGGNKSLGQSATLPTAALPIEGSTAQTQPVQSQDGAGSQQQPEGRFHGKRYYDHPVWVSLQDWLAEGGTEADYQWRPDRLHSAGF